MSTPINYVSTTIKYATPIVYPTKNTYSTASTTTTTTNSNMYVYTSSNKKKYYSTSTNPGNVRYTNYPHTTHTTYYSKPQYIYPTTNQKKIVYIQTPVNVNQNTQTIKYHNITTGTYPTIKTNTTGGVATPITTTNNVIYNQYGERGTNYQIHNPLNLNNIYNVNNVTTTIPQVTYESKTSDDNNIIYADIGNFRLRNTNPKINQKQVDPNVYFNNNDPNLVTNTTTTQTANEVTLNNDAYFNYSEYPSIQNNYIEDINNKTTNTLNKEIDELLKNNEIIENDDKFNNTMPTPKIKEQISSQYNLTVKGDNTMRKSEPNQIASNFEISINNNPKKQYKNNILAKCNVISFQHLSTITKKSSNNVQIKTDDVKIEAQKEPEPEPESNNTQTKNEEAQDVQTDSQNPENVEYMDQFGNIYLLVNGQYIDKRYFMNQNEVKNDTNIENKTETNVEQSNNNEAVKTSVNKENGEPEHIKNKDNVYYEEDQKNPEGENPNTNTEKIIEQNQQIQNEENQNQNEIKYHDINLNMNMNLNQQGYLNNEYFNNAYQSQNQNVKNERGNRFKQDQIIYTDVNLNNNMSGNYDYNLNLLRSQPNQINNINMNNDQYKKSQNDKMNDNDNTIMIVQPQKPKKRRPVYKIPPSKKRAVSHGKSLNFIHKYYDENFILEEDNEDNVSDDGNKKQKKNLKSIFKGVTNMKRLTHQWQQLNENHPVEQSENIIINSEEQKKTEGLNENIDNSQNANTNLEESSNPMRLSHIGFSL
jgi:hypothetical protein